MLFLSLVGSLLRSCSGGTSPFVLPKPLRLAPKPPKLGEEVMAVGHPGNWAWLVGNLGEARKVWRGFSNTCPLSKG